jgi:hypothetical protein
MLPSAEKWTRERATAWWRSHLPQPGPARPMAEVLLSGEGSPQRVRRAIEPIVPTARRG